MKYKLTGKDKTTGENQLSSFNQIIDSKWTQVFDVLFTVPGQDFGQVNPHDFLRSDEIVADMMCYIETRWIDWGYKQVENKEKIRWKAAAKEAIFKQFQNYCDEYRKRIPMPLFKWKKNKTAEPVVDALVPPPPPPVVHRVEHAVVEDDDVVVENNPMDDSLLQMMNAADDDMMNTSHIMDNPLPGANVMDFSFLEVPHAEVVDTRGQELQRQIESLEEDKTMMHDSIHALQNRLAEANGVKITLENKLREVNEINTTLEDRLRMNRQMMDERDKEMKQALNSKEEALRAKDAEVTVLLGERDKLIREYEERLANMEKDMENKKRELREKMLELFDDNLNENNKRGRLNSLDEEEPKRRRMSVDIYEQETVIGEEEEPEAEAQFESEEAEVVDEVVVETVTETVVDAVVDAVVEAVNETVVETVVETVAETVAETVVETVVDAVVEVEGETVAETVADVVVETVVEAVVVGDMDTIWNNRNTILLEELKKEVGFAFFKRKINSSFDERKHKRSFLRKIATDLETQWFTDGKLTTKSFWDFCQGLGEKYQHWFTEREN